MAEVYGVMRPLTGISRSRRPWATLSLGAAYSGRAEGAMGRTVDPRLRGAARGEALVVASQEQSPPNQQRLDLETRFYLLRFTAVLRE